ncbi:MAG: hypothetical protein K9G62_00610 [Alphaproteobacteria bacterium]|nr:hypothetical protein [Alphaproteobacteria bacterium]
MAIIFSQGEALEILKQCADVFNTHASSAQNGLTELFLKKSGALKTELETSKNLKTYLTAALETVNYVNLNAKDKMVLDEEISDLLSKKDGPELLGHMIAVDAFSQALLHKPLDLGGKSPIQRMLDSRTVVFEEGLPDAPQMSFDQLEDARSLVQNLKTRYGELLFEKGGFEVIPSPPLKKFLFWTRNADGEETLPETLRQFKQKGIYSLLAPSSE